MVQNLEKNGPVLHPCVKEFLPRVMKKNYWIKNLKALSEKDKPKVTQSDKKQFLDPKLENIG